MNTSILVDSLKYLTSRFIFISRLSKWIQESLAAIQYSESKVKKILENIDEHALRNIIHLVTNESIFKDYIDRFLLKTIDIQIRSTNIMILIYQNNVKYMKKQFIIHSFNRKIVHDVIELCEQQLLNELLDYAILNKKSTLTQFLIYKGAVLDKLTLDDDIIINSGTRIFMLLVEHTDRESLYKALENIAKKNAVLLVVILFRLSPFKDQKFLDLVIRYNIPLGIELFLQNGFDPDSVKVNENTSVEIIDLIEKYKKWRI